MPLYFNLEKVHPSIWNELQAENDRICTVVNEMIAFCNEKLRKESKLEGLEKGDLIWTDGDLLPERSRMSTIKMAMKFDGQVYQRSSIATNLGSKLEKITTQKGGAFCQEKINKASFALLRKELKSRRSFLQLELNRNPNNEKCKEYLELVNKYLSILAALRVQAQIKIAELASMDCLAKVIDRLEGQGLTANDEVKHLLNRIQEVILRHQLIGGKPYTHNEVLKARNDLDRLSSKLINLVKKQNNLSDKEKTVIVNWLEKSNAFYKLKNDVNGSFPLDRKTYAMVRDSLEKTGGYTSLIASAIFVAATPLSFTPLAPIAAPTAAVSGAVATLTGLPTIASKVGRTSFNAIKYHAAPTSGELIILTLAGVSFLTGGVGGISASIWSSAVSYGVTMGETTLHLSEKAANKGHSELKKQVAIVAEKSSSESRANLR